jgi:hypothetical protein
MASGIVLVVLGSVLAATGGPLLATGSQTCSNNGMGFDCSTPGHTAAIGLLIAGGSSAALGIPLIAYGARYEEPDDAALHRAWPAWAGGPASRGWAWTF